MRSTSPPLSDRSTVLATVALAAVLYVLAGASAALDLPQPTNLSPAAYLVTVTNPGPGAGTISSDSAGLSCDTSCRGWFPAGSTLTLTAAVGTGSEFLRWFGDCEGTGTCSLTVDGPKMAVGTFKVTGDPYTVLRHFMPGNHDAAGPYYAQLVWDGTYLYGMTLNGGRADSGAVFRIRPDGTDREILHEFVGGPDDGRQPWGSLTLLGGALYGMTLYGGSIDTGVVFKLGTDGSGFEVLHSFAGPPDDGQYPFGSLAADGGAVFGMTMWGGSSGRGTVFRLGADGSGYQVLHSFSCSTTGGCYPRGSLTPVSGLLFGMTRDGGAEGSGTIFKLKSDGTEHQVLHSFDWDAAGARPYGSLIESSGVLYGMTSDESSSGGGAAFRVNLDGTDFQVLANLGLSNGSTPYGSLTLHGGALFGLTSTRGTSGGGTIFKVGTDGSGFMVLHGFPAATDDGSEPYGSLVAVGEELFGLTRSGGAGLRGTLFRIRPDGTSYQVVHAFSSPGPECGQSYGDLAADGQGLFGTAYQGGTAGLGAVFRVNANGSGYQILHSFTGGALDGARPYAGVALVGGVLYGTTIAGGRADRGTVFRVGTDGTGFELLHSFGVDASDGRQPFGAPVHENGVLYGTASLGGPGNGGVVFKIRTDGLEYAVLVDLGEHDGDNPEGTLVLHDGALFGTTTNGPFYGSVFRVRTDGTGYTRLHLFGTTTGDGRSPMGSLVLHGDTLFGTTVHGGSGDRGVLFSLRSDGSDYRILRTFGGFPGDGADPGESIWVDGNVLYGQARSGGAFNRGCLFRAKLDGTEFQLLRSFSSTPADGGGPVTAPVGVDGALYGLTSTGGAGSDGVLYSLRKEVAVSGSVTADGSPLPGVTLLGLRGSPVTGANGQYTASVPLRWSGTVTPVLAGRSFTPPSRALTDVQSDQTGQDFTASTCAVLSLSPDTLPTAWLGTPFSLQLSVLGGPGPFTFSLVSGSLPAGLALDGSTGLVSGTPTSAGTVEISVVAVDGAGCSTFRVHEMVVSSYLTPVALRIDEVASGATSSDLNGVLEEGETVAASPSWLNSSTMPRSVTSVATNPAGPAEGDYSLRDSSAAYGTIPPGATVGAGDATGDIFAFLVNLDAWTERPAPHWDARFTETLNDGTVKTWTLHIGDSFADVARSHWAYRFIETIFHNSVTSGCNAEPFNYCPGATLTRAEMAVLLLMAKHGSAWRPPASTGTVFTDVPIDHWAGDFIEQLATEGITSGCGTGLYCPDAPITRAEMAVFLIVAEHGTGYTPPASTGTVFTDVPIDHWAGDFIEQLAAEGITGGCATGLYCPTGVVTRAEMAVFLTATFGLQLNN